jgi:hypothetical protein
MRIPALLLLTLAATAGCVDRLPDQDLRILGATAIAKMPVEDLIADYRTDKTAADRRYWGKPIEVSGEVTTTRESPAGPVLVFSDKSGAEIVQASLLDDRAAAVLAAVGESRRVRLKCYCDGLTTTVRLKSCVLP